MNAILVDATGAVIRHRTFRNAREFAMERAVATATTAGEWQWLPADEDARQEWAKLLNEVDRTEVG